MKKIVALTLATSVAAGLFLSGCAMNESGSTSESSSGADSGKREVNVCSWGEYIDRSLETQFEEATGIETRATILGHMQRGGSPTCKDRVYASIMGAMAVDLLCQGKTNRVVGYKNGEYVDFDIEEALSMKKTISDYQYNVAKTLAL